jgi:ankyrin repeat protein
VQALVAAGASLGGTATGPTAFNLAVSSGHDSWDTARPVAMLLWNAMLEGPSAAALTARAVGWRSAESSTVLHTAAKAGCKELVTQLLLAGASKDAVDGSNVTPLWLAAHHGHSHLVPLLLTHDNLTKAKSALGVNCGDPLCTAAEQGHDEVVSVLLAAGARVDERHRPDLQTPLFLAVQHGRVSTIRVLLAAGTRADRQGSIRNPYLAVAAAANGHAEVVTLLLEALVSECAQEQSKKAHAKQAQQDGDASLIDMVTTAVTLLARRLEDTPGCALLLGVVLDVLGQEVAMKVCKAVQKQLKQEDRAAAAWGRTFKQTTAGPMGSAIFKMNPTFNQLSHLAEALLLGLLRHPPEPRLQRQVPGVGGGPQQEGKQEESDQQQSTDQQLVQLVKEAALAAAKGKEKKVLRLMGEFQALHLQSHCTAAAADPSSEGTTSSTTSLVQLVHQGLVKAARVQLGAPADGTAIDPVTLQHACSFHPKAVYKTFLAAWVAARQEQAQKAATGAVAAAVTGPQQASQETQGPAAQLQLQQQPNAANGVGQLQQQEQQQQQLKQKPDKVLVLDQWRYQQQVSGAARQYVLQPGKGDGKLATPPPGCGCGLWQVGDLRKARATRVTWDASTGQGAVHCVGVPDVSSCMCLGTAQLACRTMCAERCSVP